MKKITLELTLAFGLTVLLLTGCGGGDAPPAEAPAPVAEKPAKDKVAPPKGGGGRSGRGKSDSTTASVSSPGKSEKLKDWRYNPETKWDPFIQPEIAAEDTTKERFDIDQMILYGVVRGSGMDRAFIRLPDNTDRIIKVGDILGKHNGRVVRIEENTIVVEEKYYDPGRPDEIFVINKVLPLVKLSK